MRVNRYNNGNARRNIRLLNVRHSLPANRPKIKMHKTLQKNALKLMQVQSSMPNDYTPNSTLSKNEIIKSFLMRNANPSIPRKVDERCQREGQYEPFALKFKKFTVRDF